MKLGVRGVQWPLGQTGKNGIGNTVVREGMGWGCRSRYMSLGSRMGSGSGWVENELRVVAIDGERHGL